MKRILFLGFCLVASSTIKANISLPAIFTDHMVLQQKSQVNIWGWAKPRENIKLVASWDGDTLTATTDNQSHWSISLSTPAAGGPHQIYLMGHNTMVLSDVLIGEVWLCSGQSNMEWKPTSGINDAEAEIAAATHPNIRFFTVEHRTAMNPQIDISSKGWTACTPETMKDFSAVAYFFARRIQQETGVPVGLINSSWGGTPAEAWTPETVYQGDETLAASAALLDEVPWGPVQPGRIFNSMIAPVTKFQIAGTIWYQGESNTRNADTYKRTFSSMINSWRDLWGYSFPFYFVQIAPFPYGGDNDHGVKVRDAQRRTLELSQTGMVVTSDIGDTTDIHPRNKLDVGIRLANLALKHHYEQLSIIVDSPLYKEHLVDKNKVTIHFKNASGLHSETKEVEGFELAGQDGVYHPARASIKGESVVVRSKQVKEPIHVRFAWNNTAIPTLYNQAHLPASSFCSEFE